MKVFSMVIMVMGNTLEVKQLMLCMLFMRHKRTKASKGQPMQRIRNTVTNRFNIRPMLPVTSNEYAFCQRNAPCEESG